MQYRVTRQRFKKKKILKSPESAHSELLKRSQRLCVLVPGLAGVSGCQAVLLKTGAM